LTIAERIDNSMAGTSGIAVHTWTYFVISSPLRKEESKKNEREGEASPKVAEVFVSESNVRRADVSTTRLA